MNKSVLFEEQYPEWARYVNIVMALCTYPDSDLPNRHVKTKKGSK